MSWSPWIWMYLNEQIPMVCSLGCLENKYFPGDLIFCVGWFCTEPSGSTSTNKGVLPSTMVHGTTSSLL